MIGYPGTVTKTCDLAVIQEKNTIKKFLIFVVCTVKN